MLKIMLVYNRLIPNKKTFLQIQSYAVHNASIIDVGILCCMQASCKATIASYSFVHSRNHYKYEVIRVRKLRLFINADPSTP